MLHCQYLLSVKDELVPRILHTCIFLYLTDQIRWELFLFVKIYYKINTLLLSGPRHCMRCRLVCLQDKNELNSKGLIGNII